MLIAPYFKVSIVIYKYQRYEMRLVLTNSRGIECCRTINEVEGASDHCRIHAMADEHDVRLRLCHLHILLVRAFLHINNVPDLGFVRSIRDRLLHCLVLPTSILRQHHVSLNGICQRLQKTMIFSRNP